MSESTCGSSSGRGEFSEASGPVRRVLFVCMGNICRSPAAEGVFAWLVESRGLSERIGFDSAGMIGYHAGKPADPRMREAASRRGYALRSRARAVTRADLERFDLIVAMDRDNLLDLESLVGGPRPHVRMLGSFLIEPGAEGQVTEPMSVPDPYYGGESGFERVLDMLERAMPAVLEATLATSGATPASPQSEASPSSIDRPSAADRGGHDPETTRDR